MNRKTNPFRAGAGTPPPVLVGREDLLEGAEIAAERILDGEFEKSILLNGLRGVGKTVLLNRFAEIADRTGYENVVLEATEDGHFLEMFAQEIKDAGEELTGGGKITDAIRRAIAILQSFSITYGLSGTVDLKFEVGTSKKHSSSGNHELDLRKLIVALGEAAKEKGSGLFIAIDEMQYLSREELSAIISAVHFAAQRQLPVFVVGAGLPNLPALAAEAKTYAERLFEFPIVGSLQYEDVRKAILGPAESRDVSFADDALEEINRITQGYPYFVQEWARDAWNIAEKSPISIHDVHAATETVRDRLDANFFRARFDRLTPREQLYLRAMAELGSGPHSSGAIAQVLNGSASVFATARDALIGKGMIYSPAYGQTAFSVPLFDEFMRRKFPELHELRTL